MLLSKAATKKVQKSLYYLKLHWLHHHDYSKADAQSGYESRLLLSNHLRDTTKSENDRCRYMLTIILSFTFYDTYMINEFLKHKTIYDDCDIAICYIAFRYLCKFVRKLCQTASNRFTGTLYVCNNFCCILLSEFCLIITLIFPLGFKIFVLL